MKRPLSWRFTPPPTLAARAALCQAGVNLRITCQTSGAATANPSPVGATAIAGAWNSIARRWPLLPFASKLLRG
jgi:hypothetical protein